MKRELSTFVDPGPRQVRGPVSVPQPEMHSPQHTAKSDDTAVTITIGSLIYSAVYMAVFFVVVLAGVGLVLWYNSRVDPPIVGMVALLVWGGASYGILSYNREQGLYHSATGIAHHQIDSEERRGKYALGLYVWAQLKERGLLDDADGHRLLDGGE